MEWRDLKGYEKILELIDRYTYYNDYGHGYADAYVSKLITLYILICAIYYMSVIPQ